MFVDAGRNNIRDYLAGSSPTPPSHVAWGSDDSSPAVTDTTLGSEVVRISVDSTSTSDKQVQFSATLSSTQGNGNTLKELGLLNAASGGTLFSRDIFTAVDKDSSIELKSVITVNIN